jgi:outer membrane lipoprotein LolB
VRAPFAAAAALLVALGGCQSVPVRPAPAPQTAALLALDSWRASGRVAVRSADAGFSASFDWQEHGGAGLLAVRGPFGAGAARIASTAQRIRIDSGNGAPLEIAAPFEALEPELAARLGFALPVDPLRYWILGVPAPGLPREGEGASFSQAGWSVLCSAYVPVAGVAAPLPTRLELVRGSTRIRVKVDRWQAGSE